MVVCLAATSLGAVRRLAKALGDGTGDRALGEGMPGEGLVGLTTGVLTGAGGALQLLKLRIVKLIKQVDR